MSTVTAKPGDLVLLDPGDKKLVKFDYTTDNLAAAAAISTSTFKLTPLGRTARRVLSLTRSGTTATLTTGKIDETGTLVSADHGLATGDYVTVSDADQVDYNLTTTITVTTSSAFTYTVANSPVTPATGTIIYGGPSISKDNPGIVDSNRNTQVRVDATTGELGAAYELANTIVTNESPTQTKEYSIRILVQNR